MTMKFVSNSMLRPQRVVEYDNSLADLQRRWQAYHANNAAESLQQLVNDTRHLEQITGMQPGQLLDKLRRAGG
jgi:hypothetical protein